MIKRQVKPIKYDYLSSDTESIKHALANRLEYSVGKDTYTATQQDWYHVAAYVVRDRLMERWMETQRTHYREDTKRIYYLSMEFLIGRTLTNSLLNMGFYDEFKEAIHDIGLDLEEIATSEHDAALGNGGLGRLAACFMDSMATLSLPGYGYGIRYEYGMFTQRIENGYQMEHPENWLHYGNPWEFPRPEILYPVKFYGRVVTYQDPCGQKRHHWIDTEDVMAMAYDTPVPGYGNNSVINLRLWSAKASRDFDLRYFNQGNYLKAVEEKNESENLSKVLYPDDTTVTGRKLRLKQQYFFVSASLQDIMRRYLKFHQSFEAFPERAAIQLNDTHPVLAIPELMRLLVDIHHMEWDQAWEITQRTFSYTNHTLLPEALESWPVSLLERLLPRHLQIIYDINHHFLHDVVHHFPGDMERLRRMSFIQEGEERRVRMAHLAMVGTHKVNGVAKLHTELMKTTVFRDFDEMYPHKIVNKTNGITPRRWLHVANPGLSRLICSRIGTGWLRDLEQLQRLTASVDDEAFREEFAIVKQTNKKRLAEVIGDQCGVEVSPHSLFDVQVKRIHEYKRQLLNVLHVITLYNRIRQHHPAPLTPRTVIFAGKAAPGYHMAKRIIKLINDVADIVNNDPAIGDQLKVVFIPNYNVSLAETIIPAADISQQISTAGTEASGTGNMKFALNGALIVGTLDGANIEIRDAVGENNIFIFGLNAREVEDRRTQAPPSSGEQSLGNLELGQTLDMLSNGYFSPEQPDLHRPIIDKLIHEGDPYLVLAEYAAYIACQEQVAQVYLNRGDWLRKTILNVAHMGRFSSDRTVREYAEEIWGVKPVTITLSKPT